MEPRPAPVHDEQDREHDDSSRPERALLARETAVPPAPVHTRQLAIDPAGNQWRRYRWIGDWCGNSWRERRRGLTDSRLSGGGGKWRWYEGRCRRAEVRGCIRDEVAVRPPEVVSERCHRLISPGDVAFQRAERDSLDVGGGVRPPRADRGNGAIHDFVKHSQDVA